MPIGYLKIQITDAYDIHPIREAMIRIYQKIREDIVYESFHTSDALGNCDYIALESVSKTLSSDSQNTLLPYTTYHVEVRCEGYETLEIKGIQIFEDIYSTLPLTLKTCEENIRNLSTVPKHALLKSLDKHQDSHCFSSLNLSFQIPKTIQVHLGIPNSKAENLEIDFVYYLKNIISSEIFPTWSENAIRFFVYVYTTFVLKRIHTKWYKEKGFDFDISNSAIYDPTFVKNRNIFDNISEIVDEIFNEYIQEFSCDKPLELTFNKWEIQNHALQGYTSLQILQQFYGEHVQLVTTNRIQNILPSYPGTVFKKGSKGYDVSVIQKWLNITLPLYSNTLPLLLEDEELGEKSEQTIKAFQKQFCQSVDGEVGKCTWYQLARLSKHIEMIPISNLTNDHLLLSEKQSPVSIKAIKEALNIIGFIYSAIPVLVIDDQEDEELMNAIEIFQKNVGISVNRTLDEITCKAIFTLAVEISEGNDLSIGIPAYPKTNWNQKEIKWVQHCLNVVSKQYNIDSLVINGIFDEKTKTTLSQFQSLLGLPLSIELNRLTWYKLNEIYVQLIG